MTNYISLREAADLVPTSPAVCTIWRWCVNGIHVRKAAQTIKLRSVFIGRKMFTTADWLEEFIHRLTAARLGSFEAVIDHKCAPADEPGRGRRDPPQGTHLNLRQLLGRAPTQRDPGSQAAQEHRE